MTDSELDAVREAGKRLAAARERRKVAQDTLAAARAEEAQASALVRAAVVAARDARWRQPDIARALGLTQQAVSRILREPRPAPTTGEGATP